MVRVHVGSRITGKDRIALLCPQTVFAAPTLERHFPSPPPHPIRSTILTTMSPFSPSLLSTTRCFSCKIDRYTHTSPTLGSLPATFSVILPPTATAAIYWLSGLTCTDQNFVIKAAAASHAHEHSVAIICPDTSPRGAGAPEEDDTWDFGTGAGFYVDATTEPYKKHYRMASYVVHELPLVVKEVLGDKVGEAKAIMGHSMGGMGALSLALRNPGLYTSVSAFSPIANPVNCPWGEKCYSKYLGENREAWGGYDPSVLMKKRGEPLVSRILVEQGGADEFLEKQLMTNRFMEACNEVGQKVS